MDIGVVSNQSPRFRILKNQLPANSGGFINVKLVGGNDSAEPGSQFGPRDPIGTTLVATIGDQKREFRLSGGEGFSVQNARSIHIGLGEHPAIERLEVRWPNGETTVREQITAGLTVEIFEGKN